MNQTTPDRVRIFSHLTQSKFLHVEDTLVIGKARLFAGTYQQGSGMSQHTHHFIDMPDARVVFSAIARAEQGYKYTEYKGSPPSTRPGLSQRDGNGAISRVLSVAIKGTSVYIELKTGPGKLTPTGAITPNGKPDVAVTVSFKLHEARRLAETVLAYMQAWDVLRMLANQHAVSKPTSYLLVPQARGAATNAAVPASPTPAPVSVPGNSRPVTSKAPAAAYQPNPPTPEVTPGEDKTAVNTADALQYGDGTLVDAENVIETTTFRQFVADRNEVPASKAALVDFYRQRV